MHIQKKYIFLEVYINVNYIETIQSKLKKKQKKKQNYFKFNLTQKYKF